MNIIVSGKHIDIGESLKAHITSHFEKILTKYFSTVIDASIVVSKSAQRISTDIMVHVAKNQVVRVSEMAEDPYSSVDTALSRLDKVLARHKQRARDHHAKEAVAENTESSDYYILDASGEAEEEKSAAVIAEMTTWLPRLTVKEAVNQMDIASLPVMVFRNTAHGRINVVYKRQDGNIGWVDPGKVYG